MKCPYVMFDTLAVCKAAESDYHPGMFELGEFCFKDRHRSCISYCRRHIAENAEAMFGGGREESAADLRK